MEMQQYELHNPVLLAGVPVKLAGDPPDAPTNKGTALIIGSEDDEVSGPQQAGDPPDKPTGPKGTALPIWGED